MSIDVLDPEREPASLTAEAPRQVGRGALPFVRFVARRLAAGLVTLLVVSFLIFMAENALPGGVAEAVLGKDVTPEQIAALEQKLDLDRPLLERYADWLGGIAQGDLGDSAAQLAQGATSAPVTELIGPPLRNSLVLALLAALFIIPLALIIGTIAGVNAGRPTDYAASYSALVLGSLPEFVLGTFLIVIFFSWLDVLPPVALVPPGANPLSEPDALVLPVMTLVFGSVAAAARQVRAGVVETLHHDYVTMARLNGERERQVLWRHVLRNALAPSVQTVANTLQYLLGGIIVVEMLFAYPGIGQQLVHAVEVRDVTEVQAIALILAAVYIAINIVADLIVVLLVPKLRTALR